ncbi:MAG: glycosyltransferase [Desulfobacterales bacterium]|nr:glycosyltransferase [Desulfobacterales bacterium]
MPKISAVLIVKNEQEMLPKCLESIQDFDEIVILDTGSTDSTPDIIQWVCREAPRMPGPVSASTRGRSTSRRPGTRPSARRLATGYSLSTPTRQLPPDTCASIKEYVQRLDPKVRVVGFWVESVRGTSRHHSPRLYRNDPEVHWVGSVHNYLSMPEEVQSDMVVKAGFSPTHKVDPDRALRMLERAVLDEPESARNWYYLGREYGYKGNWAASGEGPGGNA